MRTTGKSRGDGVLAASVALVVNGLMVWQLQVLLAPRSTVVLDDVATAALELVWIAAPLRRDTVLAAPARSRSATDRPLPAINRPRQARANAKPEPAVTEPSADLPSARPMAAVYLQQAGQWAQDHPVTSGPADPFASRRVALADQPASRFRLKRPFAVADAVAMVGAAFGNPPHPCVRNPDDVAGYATGGDALALAMALDVDRHCRP